MKPSNPALDITTHTIGSLEEICKGFGDIKNDPVSALGKLRSVLSNYRNASLAEQFWNWTQSISRDVEINNYINTEPGRLLLEDLLTAIDHGIIKTNKNLNIMLNIFERAAEIESTDLRPYEFIKIASQLTATEVVIMASTYQVFKEKDFNPTANSEKTWFRKVAAKCGLKHGALIERYDKSLVSHGLLQERTTHGSVEQNHFRLTDAGIEFCKFCFDSKEKI